MKVVAGKDLLVKVNVTTTTPAEALPEGTLVVTNAAGTTLATLPLNKPTGGVGSSVPARPDMALAYTARLTAGTVAAGIKLSASLTGNGQAATVATPVVQVAPHIRIVAVPIAYADDANGTPGRVGVPLPAATVQTGFLDRAPLAQVTYEIRSTPIALDYPRGTAGKDTLADILALMVKERTADPDKTLPLYYSGTHYGPNGGGLGYMPGYANSLGDWGGNANNMLGTFLHEHGHNFSVHHAPACIGTAGFDASFPYDGGMLGNAARAITPFFMSQGLTQALVDPTAQTDRMGYCFPAARALSDYSFMKAFNYLSTQFVKEGKSAAQVQDLIYLSGTFETNGTVTFNPVEGLTGVADSAQTGDWSVRITATSGRVYTYPIEIKELSHAPERHFTIAVPNPGPLVAVELINTQQQVVKRQATTLAKAASTQSTGVQWSEANGRMVATWDTQAFSQVVVKWIKDGRSVTLTNPRQGGSLSVNTRTLGAGGEFEFSLSDGLNTTRVRYRR